jgi:hypothetical protein
VKRLDQESSKQSRTNEKSQVIESQPAMTRTLLSDELTPSIHSQSEEFIEEQTSDLDRSKTTYLVPFCIIT